MTAIRSGTRYFYLAWLGQLISNIGSGLTGVALGVWVLQRTQTVTDFSLFMLALQLPGTLLLPLVGVFIDRWNRRTAMFVCFLGGALSTATVLVLLETGLLAFWNIAICSAVTFTFIAFHGPAYFAAVCQMLPKEKLVRASGLTQLSIGLAMITAPILGGLLLQEIGVRGILLVDLATFVFAMGMMASIRIPRAEEHAARTSLLGALRENIEGWRFIRSNKGFLLVLVLLILRNVFLGITQTVAPPMLLRLEAGDFMTALMAFSVGGLGLILSGALLAAWGRMKRVARGVLLAESLMSLGIALLGCSSHVAALAAAIFLIYLALPFSVASTQVLMQYKTPITFQGRVVSCVQMMLRAALPLGTIVSGPLVDRLFNPLLAADGPLAGSVGSLLGVGQVGSIRMVLVLVGILCMVTVTTVWFQPSVRRLDDESTTATPERSSHEETSLTSTI